MVAVGFAQGGDEEAGRMVDVVKAHVQHCLAAMEQGDREEAEHQLDEAKLALDELTGYCLARLRELFPVEAAEVEAAEEERVTREIEAAPRALRPLIREHRDAIRAHRDRFTTVPLGTTLSRDAWAARAREHSGRRRVRGTATSRGGDGGDRPRSSDDDEEAEQLASQVKGGVP